MEWSNETARYLDTFENPTLLFKAKPVRGERGVSNETGGRDLDQDLTLEGGFGRWSSRHALAQRRLKRILRPFLLGYNGADFRRARLPQ